jgi:hypothetical protein
MAWVQNIEAAVGCDHFFSTHPGVVKNWLKKVKRDGPSMLSLIAMER